MRRTELLARVVATIGALFVLISIALMFPIRPAQEGADGWTYLAAGERLNAGHPLYSLSAGDRPVAIRPPYWTVPMLSPPPIAVPWRALALLGDVSMYLWWAGGLIAMGVLVAWMLARGSPPVLFAAVVGSSALVLGALSGNAYAYLVPLLAVAWIRRDRPELAGAAVAILISVKIAPVLLVPWVIARGGGRALVAVGAAIGALTLVGAGPASLFDWLRGASGSAPSPQSLAAVLGWSTTATMIAAAVVMLAVWVVAPRRDGLLFAVGLVTTLAATPAVYFGVFAMLIPIALTIPGTRNTRPEPEPETGAIAGIRARV